MLRKDRTLLRNLVIVVVGGTGAAMAIGAACLGRGERATPDPTAYSQTSPSPAAPVTITINNTVPSAAPAPTDDRSSVGGTPGTTTITSGEINRTTNDPGTSASGAPSATTTLGAPRATATMGTGAPPVAVAPAPSTSAAPSASPAPSSSAAPSASTTPNNGNGTVPPIPPVTYRTPTQGLEAGAGPFLSEPSPFSASSFQANPEAGAGRFSTDTP